jgi:hypothetical protein
VYVFQYGINSDISFCDKPVNAVCLNGWPSFSVNYPSVAIVWSASQQERFGSGILVNVCDALPSDVTQVKCYFSVVECLQLIAYFLSFRLVSSLQTVKEYFGSGQQQK